MQFIVLTENTRLHYIATFVNSLKQLSLRLLNFLIKWIETTQKQRLSLGIVQFIAQDSKFAHQLGIASLEILCPAI